MSPKYKKNSDMEEEKVSGCCEGEYCTMCPIHDIHPATQKVAQVQFDDVPSIGHGYTAYLCKRHFEMVMGIRA